MLFLFKQKTIHLLGQLQDTYQDSLGKCFWLKCDRVRKFVSKLAKWRSGESGISGWTIGHQVTKLFGHFFVPKKIP